MQLLGTFIRLRDMISISNFFLFWLFRPLISFRQRFEQSYKTIFPQSPTAYEQTYRTVSHSRLCTKKQCSWLRLLWIYCSDYNRKSLCISVESKFLKKVFSQGPFSNLGSFKQFIFLLFKHFCHWRGTDLRFDYSTTICGKRNIINPQQERIKRVYEIQHYDSSLALYFASWLNEQKLSLNNQPP